MPVSDLESAGLQRTDSARPVVHPAAGRLSRIASVAAEWLCGLVDEKSEPAWRAWLAYAVSVWAVVLVVAAVGPITSTDYPEDTMYLLSVGHRLSEGYRPYVDFHLGHGPLTFLLMALGVQVAGVSMHALWIGQMVAIAALGSLSFWVYRQRLTVFWAGFLTLTATSMLASPSPLGMRVWREFSYAMFYNKLAFVLLGIVALSVLIPVRQVTPRRRMVASILDGVALGLLACTKASFGVPAVCLYVFGKLVWPQAGADRRRDVWPALLVMAVLWVSVLTACGSSVVAYAQAVATYKKGWDAPVLLLLGRYLQYTDMIFYLGLLLVLTYGVGVQSLHGGRPLLRNAVMCAVVAAGFFVVTATCCQDYNVVPLLGVVPLAAIVWVHRRSQGREAPLGMAVAVLGTILLLGAFIKDAALASVFAVKRPPTLTAALSSSREDEAELSALEARTQSSAWSTLRYIRVPDYTRDILAALALLESSGCAKGDVLYVCRPVDAVTPLTQCRYPRGARGVYAWHMVLTGAVEADLQNLYGDDFLSQTKWILRYAAEDGIWQRLERVQGENLAAHFEAVAQNGGWTLYRHR